MFQLITFVDSVELLHRQVCQWQIEVVLFLHFYLNALYLFLSGLINFSRNPQIIAV